jgi:hypothetical protein
MVCGFARALVRGTWKRILPNARPEALGDQFTFIEPIDEDAARYKTRLEHITAKSIGLGVEASIRPRSSAGSS